MLNPSSEANKALDLCPAFILKFCRIYIRHVLIGQPHWLADIYPTPDIYPALVANENNNRRIQYPSVINLPDIMSGGVKHLDFTLNSVNSRWNK